MINSNTYDIVVYGASLAGIMYVLKKRTEGKNVLLINRYGFPGGSITSGLNCLQKFKEPEQAGFYEQFISSLKKYKYGVLYSDESHVLVNPEAVKMILQELLLANDVDMLFHVNPLSSEEKNGDKVELELIGKDGINKVVASSLMDASENFLLSFIHGRFQPREIGKKVNLFTTKPSEYSFLTYEGISSYRKLSDGRYWVSLTSMYDQSEKEARKFASILHLSGARIQLMPPEVYSHFNLDLGKGCPEGPVKSLEEILLKNFQPDEQLLKASEIEIHLCG